MRNPLCRLRGFDVLTCVILDSMHTIGGVIKGMWCLLQGLRENPRVHIYEAETNKRCFDGVHIASKRDHVMLVLQAASHTCLFI